MFACAGRPESLEAPTRSERLSARELGEQPSALDAALSNDLQGVSHDARHWYFSQAALGFVARRREHTGYLWSYPLERPLADMASVRRLDNPWLSTPEGAYRHLGGISEHQGFLFVALTPGTSSRPVPRRASGGIGVISTESVRRRNAASGYLASFSIADVQGADVPWVAADPRISPLCEHVKGPCAVLYSSPFGQRTSRALPLLRYRWTPSEGLRHVDTRDMPVHGGRLQGGVVSDRGLLYLASDADRACGIQAIDLERLEFVGCISLALSTRSDIEVEGLTYWDLDRLRAPDAGGQLHLLYLDNDGFVGNDDVSMKHFRLGAEP